MTTYADSPTLLDARERYLHDNGFDPDYDERWVKLKAGPFQIWFPNAPGRVRAVKLHDLHHLVTGYATTWTGEVEIAAWELASGCGRHAWAWGLNLSALPIGLVIAPRALLRAFVRGRRSRNLYRRQSGIDDALLAQPVQALRAELGLEQPDAPVRISDAVAFVAIATACVAGMLAVPGLVTWLLW